MYMYYSCDGAGSGPLAINEIGSLKPSWIHLHVGNQLEAVGPLMLVSGARP